MAAKTLGVSYRYGWDLLRKWSALMGHPLADLQRGRGAKLTGIGVKLLWGQRRVNARLGPMLESLASEIDAELSSVVRGSGFPPLRVHASHGLAIAILRDMLNASDVLTIDLQFRGSLDCLRTFRSGKSDIAGFHLPEGALGARLAPRYRRLLDPENDVLLHVVRREQGIMTAPGNPLRIETLADLVRRGVNYVNRQSGSGTRLILDALLEEAGIEAPRIRGYANEEFTHMAVAAMVASGAADAGFGIKAAAAQLGLHFIPLVRENYFFAIPRGSVHTPAMQTLRETLAGPVYRKRVKALPGYDPALAGNIVEVDTAVHRLD